MIKILAIGDPHSKRSNQEEIKECAKRAGEAILKTKPKAVVILGDLANDHEKLYLTALNGIVFFLDLICKVSSSVGAKVYYIVGNHDAANNQLFLTDEHVFNAFKNWPNLVVVDRVITLHSSDGLITMCPYVPPGRLVEALDAYEPNKWRTSMVIFCHQEFKGTQIGRDLSQVGDDWSLDMPMVVSGHIHDYTQLKPNILYVGAPYDIIFGDSGDKGISLLTFDNGLLVGQQRIDLGLPRKITLNLTVKEALQYKADGASNVRMNITGTTQEFAKFKTTEQYEELSKKVKIIPQITDPIKTAKNTKRKGYIDLLLEETKKENEFVKLALDEITRPEEQK